MSARQQATTMHYGTANGPACGAWFYHPGITAIGDVALATCRRCKRTDAYRRAQLGDLGPKPVVRCCTHSYCTNRTSHPSGRCAGHRA